MEEWSAVAGVVGPGSEFDGYRVIDRLGAGGWGVVYRAHDLRRNRMVALKVLTRLDRTARLRFTREARLLRGARHPHILPIDRVGEVGGYPYLITRLASGGSLRDRLDAAGPPAPDKAVHLLAQVAEALDAVHDLGIVHRDVTPANLLLEGPPGAEHVWLADFGLAHHTHDRGLTGSGAVIGTADYMAPEQRAGQQVGPAADVYSLAVVLYETMAGRLPMLADLVAGRGAPSPTPVAALAAVWRRALAEGPADRFSSAGAMIAAAQDELHSRWRPSLDIGSHSEAKPAGRPNEQVSAGPAERTRPRRRAVRWWLAATVVATVLIAILSAWVVLAPDRKPSPPGAAPSTSRTPGTTGTVSGPSSDPTRSPGATATSRVSPTATAAVPGPTAEVRRSDRVDLWNNIGLDLDSLDEEYWKRGTASYGTERDVGIIDDQLRVINGARIAEVREATYAACHAARLTEAGHVPIRDKVFCVRTAIGHHATMTVVAVNREAGQVYCEFEIVVWHRQASSGA